MAKNTMFPTKSGGGVLSKVIGTLIVVAALMLVVKHPTDAAAWVHAAGQMAGSVIDGLSILLGQL